MCSGCLLERPALGDCTCQPSEELRKHRNVTEGLEGSPPAFPRAGGGLQLGHQLLHLIERRSQAIDQDSSLTLGKLTDETIDIGTDELGTFDLHPLPLCHELSGPMEVLDQLH